MTLLPVSRLISAVGNVPFAPGHTPPPGTGFPSSRTILLCCRKEPSRFTATPSLPHVGQVVRGFSRAAFSALLGWDRCQALSR